MTPEMHATLVNALVCNTTASERLIAVVEDLPVQMRIAARPQPARVLRADLVLVALVAAAVGASVALVACR